MALIRTMVAFCVVAAACGDDAFHVRPIVEAPLEDSTADPWRAVDELELAIARDTQQAPVALARGSVGDDLALTDVPFGDEFTMRLTGFVSSANFAYGESCPFSIADDRSRLRPRVYFSRISHWGRTELATPAIADRVGGVGFRLSSGLAVVLGGHDSIEVFDPLVTGAFRTIEGSTQPRVGAVTVAFPGDAVLRAGGLNDSGDAVPEMELIVATAPGVEAQVQRVSGPRVVDHAGVAVGNGKVLLSGGRRQNAPSGPLVPTAQAWLYVQEAGTVIHDDVAPQRLVLAEPRWGHTMTRLSDDVGGAILIVGGRDAAGEPMVTTELYRPLTDGFETVSGAQLQVPRWGHQAVLMPGGSVLIVGGFTSVNGGEPTVVAEIELYDPIVARFSSQETPQEWTGYTEMSVTPLRDGRILLAGGRNPAGEVVATAFTALRDRFDGNVFPTTTAPLSMPRAGHAAVELCDGTVLVVGGASGSTAERYRPPRE